MNSENSLSSNDQLQAEQQGLVKTARVQLWAQNKERITTLQEGTDKRHHILVM